MSILKGCYCYSVEGSYVSYERDYDVFWTFDTKSKTLEIDVSDLIQCERDQKDAHESYQKSVFGGDSDLEFYTRDPQEEDVFDETDSSVVDSVYEITKIIEEKGYTVKKVIYQH